MKKREPGENLSGDMAEPKERKIAEGFLYSLRDVLEDVERDEKIDLNKTSNTHRSYIRDNEDMLEDEDGQPQPELELPTPVSMSKAEALKITLKNLKAYLDYLNPKQRHIADGLIMSAELYLAAHKPNPEE